MKEIIDDYCWEEHKKQITFDKHRIVGLKNFTHSNLSRAVPPTPMHFHSDIVEVHCLMKGKRFSQIDSDVYTIKGNELFITFPYENHSNGNLPQSPCEYYGFQIDLKYRDSLLGLNEEYSHALCDHLLNMKSRHLRFTSTLANILKQAFAFITKDTLADRQIGVQYLCCLLFHLNNLQPVSYTDEEQMDKHIQAVVDHIDTHFKQGLQLKDLAHIAGYSLSRFKSKFKQEVGITPAEFISLRKIEYAKQLLEHTHLPITDIAYEAGFSSSNYFSSVFSKLTNCTPSEYRHHYGVVQKK